MLPEEWLLRFEPIVAGIIMARETLVMRQIKELLRLKHEHKLSVREIARSCGLPISTVGDYLKRAESVGLNWPLPEELTEEQLVQKLLGGVTQAGASPPARALPDWKQIHQELRRKAVTLQLLWNEYHQIHPEGYAYSRFCELYRDWAGTLDPVLRQVHGPGQKMFVDWAGQTVPIHNATDGSLTQGHLFVAVLGASNKTFVEAFPNEQLPCWIAGHVHAYTFYGGVARVTVPDNPKTAVVRACRYEPQLHRSYAEMAEHYGTVVLPARPVRPRDKAHVETGVQIGERQILAPLRDQRFFSVGALNQAIAPLLAKLNEQPFQKLEGSRNSWFESLEKGQLLPLPATPFQLATWSQAKANIDYHVVVDNHFYSVPYQLIHEQLDVRKTDCTVEFFHQGKRVAAHPLSHQAGRATTLEEHRPKSHQKYLQWTPSRLIDWAAKTGPHCAQAVEQILRRQPHPEMGYRSCMGIIHLGKGAGLERLEAACKRALHFGTCSYRSIKSILQNHLENQPLEEQLHLPSPPHENLRGGPYYDPSSNPSTPSNPSTDP
jgi:transposase